LTIRRTGLGACSSGIGGPRRFWVSGRGRLLETCCTGGTWAVMRSPFGFLCRGNGSVGRACFYLHDRYPDVNQPRGAGPRPLRSEDGFWVVISQSKGSNHPLSAGAAVSRISLYEAPEAGELPVKLNLPPDGLPCRQLFYREEMSDGVIAGQNAFERGRRAGPGLV